MANREFTSAVNGLAEQTKTLQARIVSGSVVLLSGSSLTTAINLAYNIVIARFLGPQGFGHAAAVYTILTLISAVTLSFQIVSAKVVAQQSSAESKAAAYRRLHLGAWGCGMTVALMLVSFQRVIADYLNLPASSLVSILAIGAAFYVPLGARRGYIQGTCGFRRLAANLVLEGVVRLVGSVLAILAGLGVEGVIAANSVAVGAAYLAVAPKMPAQMPSPIHFSQALREISHAMIFFSGQVLINNCDIVLVKHFFFAKEAGLYAAVAMVGRVIFAFSSAVVNSMFPIVAGTQEEERKGAGIVATSLLLVSGAGLVLALVLSVAPARIWTSLFGSSFEINGKYDVPYLLALYAIMTIVYSLSVVIIAYEMSYKITNTSWIQLAFSGLIIVGICRYHSSLHEVILVQLVLMIALFISVALPFLFELLANRNKLLPSQGCSTVRLIRHVSEDEVIAGFLKSDFHSPEFQKYRESLGELVSNPNLDDSYENAARRALLFIRHLALWEELPTGTQWYEVEINEAGLDRVRLFPRAQWRKLARGNFSITEIAESWRRRQHMLDAQFLSKIAAIIDQLRRKDSSFGPAILIGVDELHPLTVLDGNHRMAAAMLASPDKLKNLRFLCGFSPRMRQCCWYRTNLVTLSRYGGNALRRVLRNPEAELVGILQKGGKPSGGTKGGESSNCNVLAEVADVDS